MNKFTNTFKTKFSNFKNYKNRIQYKNFEYKRSYNTKTIGPKSNNLVGYLGIAGLIGGGFLLMNTLNQPTIATGSSRAIENTSTIPKYVQEYLANTYKYVASGLILTAGAAAAAVRTGIAYKIFSFNPIVSSLCFFAGIMGSQMVK
jgi:hypothetical protein